VLEQAARSDHPTVRVAAAAGLQKRPDVSDDMAAVLMADPDRGVRKVAAKATRSRAAPAPRDRMAERGSAERESGRPATAGAVPRGAEGAQIPKDEHGGGSSSDASADAQPSAGEGGGYLGDERFRLTLQTAGTEAESGGAVTSPERPRPKLEDPVTVRTVAACSAVASRKKPASPRMVAAESD